MNESVFEKSFESSAPVFNWDSFSAEGGERAAGAKWAAVADAAKRAQGAMKTAAR